jgi:hypothetical protein
MNNQKWYDTSGEYDVGLIKSGEDVYIDISTSVGTVELTLDDIIELYEILPMVIEDAKNHIKIFGNGRRNDLQNRIVELQKELDSLEY